MKKKVTALATAAILSSALSSHTFASTYIVKKGDTLSKIANKHSTTVANLKKLNNLHSDLIYASQTLKVSTSADSANVSPPAATAVSKTYKVVSGDTLSKIALQYKVTVANLKAWNNLSSDLIYVNQTLKVSAASGSSSSNGSTTSAPSITVEAPTVYNVVSGDTLSKIALQYDVSVADLKKWNKLKSDLIYPGQGLTIAKPGGTSSQQPVQPVQPVQPKPNQNNGQTSAAVYQIKAGDTLSKIALAHNMTVAELKKLNNLTSDIIYAGRTLKVSGQVTSTPAVPDSGQTDIFSIAKSVIGTPYVWGGTTTAGFDCSGFIYYVFNNAGKTLPRTNAEGYFSRSYYVDTPQPGDLIFFENTYKSGISHLGIYLGNDQFIHADSSGVRITSVHNPYYKNHFDSYKRLY